MKFHSSSVILSVAKNPISVLFVLALLLIATGFLAVYLSLGDIAEPLILHWSEYTGIDEIGSVLDLGLIALTGFVLWFLNLILALVLERRNPMLGRVLACGTLFMTALLFLAFMAIISVNV